VQAVLFVENTGVACVATGVLVLSVVRAAGREP